MLVKLAAGGGAVRLTVADSGPGIALEERERVFDRFHRLAGGDVAGSGLGLSIVARIVELHAARLALERDSTLGGLAATVVFTGEISP